MSGAPTPQIVVEAWGVTLAPPYINVPIPVAPPGTPGLASFDEGFPPLTMTSPGSGGIPPSGADMNGILYTVSSWCASLQAGQLAEYSATAAAAFSGYKVGAILRGVTNPAQLWTNNTDGNAADPDADPSDWVSSIPLYITSAPTAGQHDDNVLPGPSDFVWDIDTSAGNVDLSGFVAQRDGQKLHISNTGANLLQVLALTGSAAGNQVRAPTDLGIIQNQTITLQYSTGAGKWLAV